MTAALITLFGLLIIVIIFLFIVIVHIVKFWSEYSVYKAWNTLPENDTHYNGNNRTGNDYREDDVIFEIFHKPDDWYCNTTDNSNYS